MVAWIVAYLLFRPHLWSCLRLSKSSQWLCCVTEGGWC